ncbi:carboxypeptidase regulatory-like domain-containing protein [Candidatus Sumerlaeota bacterium]|nr:carboxypeptidase regulatory-like domain-containing protein [Candidatus Sumerlaeota bacterium]
MPSNIRFYFLIMLSIGIAIGRTAQESPEQTGTLAIQAHVVDVDGKKPEKCMITFWKSIPAEDTGLSAEPSESRQLWHDSVTGKIWEPIHHFGASDSAIIENLVPGEYRATAFCGHGDPAALGVSDVIRLDGSQESTDIVVVIEDGPALHIQAIDEASRELVEYASIRLIRPDGLPVTAWSRGGSGIIYARDGRYTFKHLAPGLYALEAEKKAFHFGNPEYVYPPGPLKVDLTKGEDATITLELSELPITTEEAERRWPWAVSGTVTYLEGNPVECATIRASCGMGTLMPTGSASSDAKGEYLLRFGPGMRSLSSEETPLQAATISVSKDGYCEQNLYRQGGLMMASILPAADNAWGAKPEDVILPGRPKRLDFVLAPAASIEGRLTDAKGRSLSEQGLSIKSEHSWPSTSVLAHTTTDADGKFRFAGIPVGYVLWFEYAGAASEKQVLHQAKQPYNYHLSYIAPKGDSDARLEINGN